MKRIVQGMETRLKEIGTGARQNITYNVYVCTYKTNIVNGTWYVLHRVATITFYDAVILRKTVQLRCLSADTTNSRPPNRRTPAC